PMCGQVVADRQAGLAASYDHGVDVLGVEGSHAYSPASRSETNLWDPTVGIFGNVALPQPDEMGEITQDGVSDESVPVGERGSCRARTDVELRQDVRNVAIHGLDCQVQLVGDLLVRHAGGHETEDLEFAARQPVCRSPTVGGYPAQLGSGTEPFERRAGHLELGIGRLAVTQCTTGTTQQ